MKTLTKYQTSITAALTASATSIAVASVTNLPTVLPFLALLDAFSDDEEAVMVVSSVTATKTLTIVRAQRGSSAVAHGKNTLLYHSEIEAVEYVFTTIDSEYVEGLEFNAVYKPLGGTGTSRVAAAKFKVTLAAGFTFTGTAGQLWGVDSYLEFLDTAVINQANGIFAALRGAMQKSGTPVFTDAEGICALYLDCQIGIDLTNLAGGYNSSMIFMANNNTDMDSAIRIKGARIEHFVYFEQCMGKSVETGGSLSGQSYNIKILVDFSGTTRVAWILAQEDRS